MCILQSTPRQDKQSSTAYKFFMESQQIWSKIIPKASSRFSPRCPSLIAFILFCCIKQLLAVNLICNGDFENVVLSNNSTDAQGNPNKWSYVTNNYSCWYSKNATQIQVKSMKNPPTAQTNVADTVAYSPYDICQKLVLQVGAIYQFSFDMITDFSFTSCTFNVYVNNVSKYSKTYSTTLALTTQKFNFTTTASTNQICIYPTNLDYKLSLIFSGPSLKYGIMVDNVSLIWISGPNPTNTTTTNTTANTTTANTTTTTNNAVNITNSTNTTTSNSSNTSTTGNTTTNSNLTINSTNTTVTNNTTNSTTNSTMTNSTNTTDSSAGNTTANSTNMTTNSTSISNATSNTNSSTTSNSSNTTTTTNTTNTTNNTNNTTTTNTTTNTNTTNGSNSGNTTGNITNSSSGNTNINININTIIPSINISSLIPSIPSAPLIEIPINFVSMQDTKNNVVVLSSDFKPGLFGLSVSNFGNCQVVIEGDLQTGLQFKLDENGKLIIQFRPQMTYDIQSYQTIQVIIEQDNPYLKAFKFKVTVDGVQINTQIAVSSDVKLVKKVMPFTNKIAVGIRNAFLFMNAFGCSYFVINIIGFYNLTLLYYFLFLNTLPDFARMFIFNLCYIFYKRSSISDVLTQIGVLDCDLSSPFANWNISQKMPDRVDGQFWFSYYSIQTNYFVSNIESIAMLGLLVLKYLLLRFILRILPLQIKQYIDLSLQKFYHYFVMQFMCFVPFFTLSAFTDLIYISQISFIGKTNNFIQIFTFFITLLIPAVSVSLLLMSYGKKQEINVEHNIKSFATIKPVSKSGKKNKEFIRMITSFDKLIYFLMCFVIPTFIILLSKLVFFIVTTPIIVGRLYLTVKYRKKFPIYQNIIKFLNNFTWVVYHFVFFMLYSLQLISENVQFTNKGLNNFTQTCTYLGYTAVILILLGALIDIFDAIVTIFKLGIFCCKKIYRSCCKNNKINNFINSKKRKQNNKRVQKSLFNNKDKKNRNIIFSTENQNLQSTRNDIKKSCKVSVKNNKKMKIVQISNNVQTNDQNILVLKIKQLTQVQQKKKTQKKIIDFNIITMRTTKNIGK